MNTLVKVLKWSALAFGTLIALYGVLIFVFLISYNYAKPKYDQIDKGDTRAEIEMRKGLLISQEEDRSFLQGYQFVSPFRDLISNPENEIISYSIGLVAFTVIYDKEGYVLAIIDNYLDG